MKIYKIAREQQLYCDIDTAWSFFSSPFNLSKITPKDMRFTVISKGIEPHIFEGMIIEYFVSPLLRIPVKWKTKITQVEEKKSFIDFQLQGPYRYWKHFHEFIPNDDGVLIRDTIDYALPFGILGRFFHRLFVKQKLQDIFSYRFHILDQMFNSESARG